VFQGHDAGNANAMRMLTRLETADSLDPVSDKLQEAVAALVRPRRVRDWLHGTWLGHPLHPVLVQAPVGAFVCAAVLDLIPGRGRSATTLIGVGTVSAAPAVAAGLLDWSEMTKDRRRVGLVHAGANLAALGLYAGSLLARVRGDTARGKALAFAGLSVAGLGAYLGGHLAYAQGGGTNQAAPEIARMPSGWTPMGSLASLPDGRPTVRNVGDVPVLIYRVGDRVTAMIERCAHESGPLGKGEVVGEGTEACVVCPWHGSTFRLSDGAVVHGPAASSQPVLPTRVRAGLVEIRQP
jgi:nitrite reductase/ring-hydroxylating ferredoxin subunit/uncharacterized membrane protein